MTCKRDCSSQKAWWNVVSYSAQ